MNQLLCLISRRFYKLWVLVLCNAACVSGNGSFFSDESVEALAILDFHGGNLGPGRMRHHFTKKPREKPLPIDSKTIELGETLYKQYCYKCHGSDATGNGPHASKLEVRPANLKELAIEFTKNQFIVEIKEGNAAMPDWSTLLSKEEIDAVASYIVYLSNLE